MSIIFACCGVRSCEIRTACASACRRVCDLFHLWGYFHTVWLGFSTKSPRSTLKFQSERTSSGARNKLQQIWNKLDQIATQLETNLNKWEPTWNESQQKTIGRDTKLPKTVFVRLAGWNSRIELECEYLFAYTLIQFAQTTLRVFRISLEYWGIFATSLSYASDKFMFFRVAPEFDINMYVLAQQFETNIRTFEINLVGWPTPPRARRHV